MIQADSTQPSLLARLQRRDPELLSELIGEHSKPLYRTARGMGFRQDEAEDLVQDVFTTFLESLDRFEGRSQLRTWLIGILHHKAMERRRKRMQDDRHDAIDAVFEARFDSQGNWSNPPRDLSRLLESKELGAAIAHCLDGLSLTQRSVFVLREMEGLKTDEVCKIVGVTVTNMGALMHRAKNRLRECLEGSGWGATE